MNIDVDMFLLRFHDTDVVFFAIVGDKPIYQAQGYIGGAIHDIQHHFQVDLLREKLGERCEQQFILNRRSMSAFLGHGG
jgi:hypothetical protein